jgi:hypothetical protein
MASEPSGDLGAAVIRLMGGGEGERAAMPLMR